MEWVDGITLHDALEQHLLPPAPDGAGIDGLAVASLALSILRALVSTTYLEGTFAHRDISPRNIMLRRPGGKTTPDGAPTPNGMGAPDGAPTPVGTPIAWSTNTPLECCLIDLGSAIFMRRDEATFTMTMDVWRNATPEYAPPEMLALSDRGYLEARRSPAIDVYALCSVLYETYSGHTPLPSGRSSGRVGLRAKNSWPSSNSLPPRGTRCGTGRGYHVRTCSGPSRPSQRRGSFRRNRCLEDIGHRPDNRPPRSRPPRICSGSRSPHSREHTGRPERSSSATRLFRSRFSVRPGISSDD